MNPWIRNLPVERIAPERWHLELGTTHGGLLLARCGTSYLPSDAIQTRVFSDTPADVDMCDGCNIIFRQWLAG